MGAFAADVVGYTLVGTSTVARGSLSLQEPIFGTIAQGGVLGGPVHIRIPDGFIGAQCELVFTMGSNPACAPTDDPDEIGNTILACRPGIGLLGQRTASPSSCLGTLADYALHMATVCGPYYPDLHDCGLGAIVVRARIDGNEVACAPTSAVMGYHLRVVAWLSGMLRR